MQSILSYATDKLLLVLTRELLSNDIYSMIEKIIVAYTQHRYPMCYEMQPEQLFAIVLQFF